MLFHPFQIKIISLYHIFNFDSALIPNLKTDIIKKLPPKRELRIIEIIRYYLMI